MTSIAVDYGLTKQNISLIINKLRKTGMAYRTESDKNTEATDKEDSSSPIKAKYLIFWNATIKSTMNDYNGQDLRRHFMKR